MSLEILSRSLYEEIITRFFWPGLAWRGCLLNLLPSCHLELFLQLPPECFPPPSTLLPMLKALFPGTHVCAFLGLFLHLWFTFLWITHPRYLLRQACGNNKTKVCGFENIPILTPHLEEDRLGQEFQNTLFFPSEFEVIVLLSSGIQCRL